MYTIIMRKDKEQALQLRLQGRSYSEISKKLKIPKSTLSGWLNNLELSEKARNRIQGRVKLGILNGLLKHNKKQTHLARQKMSIIHSEAQSELQIINTRELWLIGVALYWAEGYKRPVVRNGKIRTHHPVSLANSDPQLVKIFLKFLRKICKVPDKKIHAEIRIFEHMNQNQILNFWQKITGLTKNNFSKVYYGISKSSQGKKPFNRLPYGTISIRVNNTDLFHKIMGWIDGLSKLGNA